MSTHFKYVNILGINFDDLTLSELIAHLKDDSQHHRNRFIVTANPEIVLAAYHDFAYRQVINNADYVTADGIGIIKGAQILNDPLPGRVTGYDTFLKLLQYTNHYHKKVYFLGAKPQVLTQMISNIRSHYPHLRIVGAHDGYFNNEQLIITQIQQTQPDFIFVALGFPKQEFFIAHHRQIVNAIWMGVGGSFDVLSGTVKRAPQFWIDHHLEWLYRLLQEPSRFKRMLALPLYLILVYKQKIQHKLNQKK